MLPVYTILDVNDAYLAVTNSERDTLDGPGRVRRFSRKPHRRRIKKKISRRTIYSFEQAIHYQKSRIP